MNECCNMLLGGGRRRGGEKINNFLLADKKFHTIRKSFVIFTCNKYILHISFYTTSWKQKQIFPVQKGTIEGKHFAPHTFMRVEARGKCVSFFLFLPSPRLPFTLLPLWKCCSVKIFSLLIFLLTTCWKEMLLMWWIKISLRLF